MARTGRPITTPRVTVECAGCGASLVRTRAQVENSKTGRFFCSKTCEQKVGANPRRGEVVACARCGKDFYRRPSHMKVRTCSISCGAQLRATDHPVKRVLVPRACLACGSNFQPHENGQKYCSPECRSKARQSRVTRICQVCGSSFSDTPAHINALFCSRECMSKGARVEKECEFCGKRFSLARSALKTRPGRYCSSDCHRMARTTAVAGRWHNGKPVVRVTSKSRNTTRTYLKVWEPDHPRAHVTGWVMEHVYEACLKYGRVISRDEHVHHVDRNGENNAWDNLVVLSHEEHARLTAIENAGRAAAADDYLIALAEMKKVMDDPAALRARLAELEAT